jgi:ElaB/YqjD/DUF883 family membrane-anchored ribosome-binding protein
MEMGNFDDKASAWAKAVGQWVGDSPWKATTFGVACGVVGYLVNIWPL